MGFQPNPEKQAFIQLRLAKNARPGGRSKAEARKYYGGVYHRMNADERTREVEEWRANGGTEKGQRKRKEGVKQSGKRKKAAVKAAADSHTGEANIVTEDDERPRRRTRSESQGAAAAAAAIVNEDGEHAAVVKATKEATGGREDFGSEDHPRDDAGAEVSPLDGEGSSQADVPEEKLLGAVGHNEGIEVEDNEQQDNSTSSTSQHESTGRTRSAWVAPPGTLAAEQPSSETVGVSKDRSPEEQVSLNEPDTGEEGTAANAPDSDAESAWTIGSTTATNSHKPDELDILAMDRAKETPDRDVARRPPTPPLSNSIIAGSLLSLNDECAQQDDEDDGFDHDSLFVSDGEEENENTAVVQTQPARPTASSRDAAALDDRASTDAMLNSLQKMIEARSGESGSFTLPAGEDEHDDDELHCAADDGECDQDADAGQSRSRSEGDDDDDQDSEEDDKLGDNLRALLSRADDRRRDDSPRDDTPTDDEHDYSRAPQSRDKTPADDETDFSGANDKGHFFHPEGDDTYLPDSMLPASPNKPPPAPMQSSGENDPRKRKLSAELSFLAPDVRAAFVESANAQEQTQRFETSPPPDAPTQKRPRLRRPGDMPPRKNNVQSAILPLASSQTAETENGAGAKPTASGGPSFLSGILNDMKTRPQYPGAPPE